MAETIKVPVLVVGGGGAGLTASMLLSRLGVRSRLVSSLPTTSTLPKAHVLNQRAMEIFRDLGIEPQVRRRALPHHLMGKQVFATAFAGRERILSAFEKGNERGWIRLTGVRENFDRFYYQ